MLAVAGAVGYFVFEIPLVLCEQTMDVTELREVRNYIFGLLKREGFPRGLGRWHFYGDVKGIRELNVRDDRKLRKMVKRGKWHPHLNVLIEGGHIELSKIKRI